MNRCKVCHDPYEEILSFGKMPLGNGFLTEKQIPDEYFYEMRVGFCERSMMFQLINQPNPEQMFHEEYAFFTGSSEGMKKHFRQFSEEIISNLPVIDQESFVVEIGSNDGTMLQNFSEKGIRCLGIEPSNNVAQEAIKNGVETKITFFNDKVAKEIKNEDGMASVIYAANVMCHIPDINSIFEGISILLDKNGLFYFEDPYLGDVINKNSFDQIYDEHVFLFSLHSVQFLASMHGLQLIHAEPQTTHGGSMRYTLAHQGRFSASDNTTKLLQKEKMLGLYKLNTFKSFEKNIKRIKEQLLDLLLDLKNKGNLVAGYGATSKSTTILNYCGINTNLISWITDTTPTKQGKLSPGSHIPVVSHSKFQTDTPDYAVLFAWNHADEIMEKETSFSKNGGKWITFFPEVKIK
jgi:methylation protein EvaC